MVSDVLHDAVLEIERYLNEPAFAKCYEGNIRIQIQTLVAAMDALRCTLDASAAGE